MERRERPRGVPGPGEQDRGPAPDDRIRGSDVLARPRQKALGLRGQPETVKQLGGVDEEHGGGPCVEVRRGVMLRLAEQSLAEERIAAPRRHARKQPPNASARRAVSHRVRSSAAPASRRSAASHSPRQSSPSVSRRVTSIAVSAARSERGRAFGAAPGVRPITLGPARDASSCVGGPSIARCRARAARRRPSSGSCSSAASSAVELPPWCEPRAAASTAIRSSSASWESAICARISSLQLAYGSVAKQRAGHTRRARRTRAAPPADPANVERDRRRRGTRGHRPTAVGAPAAHRHARPARRRRTEARSGAGGAGGGRSRRTHRGRTRRARRRRAGRVRVHREHPDELPRWPAGEIDGGAVSAYSDRRPEQADQHGAPVEHQLARVAEASPLGERGERGRELGLAGHRDANTATPDRLLERSRGELAPSRPARNVAHAISSVWPGATAAAARSSSLARPAGAPRSPSAGRPTGR